MSDPYRPDSGETEFEDFGYLKEDEETSEVPDGDLTEPVIRKEINEDERRKKKRRKTEGEKNSNSYYSILVL